MKSIIFVEDTTFHISTLLCSADVWLLDIKAANLLFFPPFLFSNDDIQNCMIYLCATMWHETYDEMLKILTSMFRLETLLLLRINSVCPVKQSNKYFTE